MKIDRNKIYNKYNGHCAYCGDRITIKSMQVDHIFPKNLLSFLEVKKKYEDFKYMNKYEIPVLENIDCEENLNPSCRKCNNYKTGNHIEIFRRELSLQVERARRQSVNFRNAERFGLIKIINKPIVFYFEKT